MKKTITFLFFYLMIGQFSFSQNTCLPEGITFTTQAEIDNFPILYFGCKEIEGDVEIVGEDINNFFTLNPIEKIGGNLIIETFTSNFVDLKGFQNLHQVGGDFRMYGNFELDSILGLTSLDTIEGDFIIESTALKSLKGLESLKDVGGDLIFFNNYGLKNFEGLNGLEFIDGKLRVVLNNDLETFQGLHNLKSIEEEVYVSFNESLKNVAGWESLESIGREFSLLHNNKILSLNSFGVVEHIEKVLIRGNDTLQNLIGLENLKSLDSLVILENEELKNMEGLNNLELIGKNKEGFFQVKDNNALENFEGLENLKNVDGDFEVKDNVQLKNFIGLDSLQKIKFLTVESNDDLIDFSGLLQLDSVENIYISSNPFLQSLAGFEKLAYIKASLLVLENYNLSTSDNFDSLDSIGLHIGFRRNDKLADFGVLHHVQSVGGRIVSEDNKFMNDLSSLSDFSNIKNTLNISGCDSLTDLTGLENLISVGNDFILKNNPNLTSVDKLSNLTFIGRDFIFSGNEKVESSTPLENIQSINGDLIIFGNFEMTSLEGFRNIDTSGMEYIEIKFNWNLEDCSEDNICAHFASGGAGEVADNATGCQNVGQIFGDCTNSIDPLINDKIRIFPNPFSHQFFIKRENQDQLDFQIMDPFGKIIFVGKSTAYLQEVDLSNVQPGIYFLKFQNPDSQKFIIKKIMKIGSE